jgi:hypothetical protein
MSLKTVASILDKILIDNTTSGKLRISLLGGEPTDHSQFEAILNLCFSRNVSVLLISNFLFSVAIRNVVLKAISSGKTISFLANATELRNRIEIFKENYNTIYTAIETRKDENLGLTCGFTFDGELFTSKGFSDYFDFISNHLISIDSVRLSLNFPGDPSNKGKFNFIKNQELGDLVYYAIRRSLYAGASPFIDCITYPCMYRSKKISDFVKKYDQNSGGQGKFICREVPEDYLPDGTVRYCFPTFPIFVDGTKYQTDTGIKSALKNKYNLLQLTAKIPDVCRECKFFKAKSCAGPCLGFLNL